jgi:hypothetical protein
MTPKGLYGSNFEADTWQEAVAKAQAAGYNVLDVTDHGNETVLVVPDDPEEEDRFTWKPGDVTPYTPEEWEKLLARQATR